MMRVRQPRSGWAARRWLACLSLGLLSWRAAAQAPPGWVVKLTPQHLILSGLWLEAEHPRAGRPQQTFIVGPQLYWGPAGRPDVAFNPDRYRYHELVRGAGLQGQHRFYLSEASSPRPYPSGFYLGYGFQVQFFHLGFSRNWQWREETGPNGLPYLVYEPTRYHETVLRYGAAGQVGYQWPLAGRVLLDFYAGVGLRQSHYWSAFDASQFRSGPSDYAHRGLYFPAGFKLGVALR